MAALQIEFHTAVKEPIGFACRLLRKAYRQGARVVVMASADTLSLLDRVLWTFDERDFVPHLRVGAPNQSAAGLSMTPIWLSDGRLPDGAPPVLVNLGADVVPLVERFDRVIEVVPDDPAWSPAARERWRRYRESGYSIKHFPATTA